MAKRAISNPPSWLHNAASEPKTFRQIPVEVFVGEVHLGDIQGWLGNPRTELHAEQFRSTYGREPTNEEMYLLALNDDDPKEGLRIRELAGNIYENGVRVPIVLTYEGRLLDGNRRYFASMFLVNEGAPKHTRKRYERIPAMVLPKGTTKDVEDAIITEFNFKDDYYEEWPYYVKAMRVYSDFTDNQMDKDELVQKYSVEWRNLRNWIRAAELCMKFLNYHEHSFLAKQFAYRNFIMFDEMMRGYEKRFGESKFRESIFEILLSGYDTDQGKFTKSHDVVRLDEIYDNPEAWDVLTSRKGSKALSEALTILELTALDAMPDPNPKLKRALSGLEKLLESGQINSVDRELLERFHFIAEEVPGAPNNPTAQVQKMVEWLNNMTSQQIAQLDGSDVDRLQTALKRVIAMSKAASAIK